MKDQQTSKMKDPKKYVKLLFLRGHSSEHDVQACCLSTGKDRPCPRMINQRGLLATIKILWLLASDCQILDPNKNHCYSKGNATATNSWFSNALIASKAAERRMNIRNKGKARLFCKNILKKLLQIHEFVFKIQNISNSELKFQNGYSKLRKDDFNKYSNFGLQFVQNCKEKHFGLCFLQNIRTGQEELTYLSIFMDRKLGSLKFRHQVVKIKLYLNQ